MIRKEIHDVNLPFSLSELRSALALSYESAPGFDYLNYSIFQKLPSESLNIMLDIINNIWISESVPDDLKHSIIILMIKPGNDPLHPYSFRSVSLTSCFSKVMERMVNLRLTHLEKIKFYPIYNVIVDISVLPQII